MSQTKARRKKQQKKKAKRRAYEKTRNIQKNMAPKRYRWDVFHEGHWVNAIREYSKWPQVEAKLDETEKYRDEGHEIIAGRVVDLVTGKVVKKIDPSPAKAQGKGALPDTLSDKGESASRGVLGLK